MQSSSNTTDFQNTLEQLKTLCSDRKLQQPLQPLKDQKEAESVHDFVSSAVNFAKSVKKGEDDAGLTLKDWNLLPKKMAENREFIKSVLINKDILLNKALQKQLLQLYWKDQAKLLQDNPKFIEALFTSVLNKTLPTSADQNQQLLQADPVLMQSLTTIANYVTSGKLKTEDPKQLAENLHGMKQALGTLHEIGSICHSESLQKTAVLLNHGLDLSVGLSQLTGKALPEGFVAMGAKLGQIGMVVSSVIGICNVFRRRKKNDDNAFALAILSYLQTISHQIYQMHSDMLRGFETVTENQRKTLNFLIKSVEHLDILIRSEAQNIQNTLHDVEQHLDTRIDNVMRLTVASGQEIHLQPFYSLMNKIDFYNKNKASATPEKIAKLNHALSNWIQRDSHFSANPLHTGTIQLTTQRDDLLHYINTEFKDVEQHPEKPIQHMAFLAQIAEKAFNVEDKRMDTGAIPNPMIWLHGLNKYLDFRREFCDVLANDNDTVISSMEVADNLSNFIKSLQTNSAIYTKLFEAYEAELKNIQSIYKQATDEVNKEINTKLLKLEDQKTLTDEKMVFDVSKDLQTSISNLDMLYNETVAGGNLDIGFTYSSRLRGSVNSSFKSAIPEKCISFNEFKNDLTDEQKSIIKNISFLQRLNILSNKSSFHVTITKIGGEKMGVLTGNISFSKKLEGQENKDEPANLYKITYDINGNNSSNMLVTVNSNNRFVKYRLEGNTTYNCYYFDDDMVANNHISEKWMYEECFHTSLGLSNAADLAHRYVNKRRFNTVELAPDYKTHKDYLQNTLNDYMLIQRKKVIKTLHDAGIGHGKEPYQSALKAAYERLDGYKTLLKCYASIAGMSQNDGTQFPEVLMNLPDSKSINERLAKYLDAATIDTPWPVDSLFTSVPAAKQAVLDAIHQEAAQALPGEDKHEPETSPLQFVCPLQIEITMHYYQLLGLMLSTNDLPLKVLSEEDERFLKQKYAECLEHFTSQEEWIKDVDTSSRCYKSLQDNLETIKVLLREDCSDINEMAQHLPEIMSRLLRIHNLLATYYRKQGYSLDVSFTKDGSDRLAEVQTKLQDIKPVMDAEASPDETLVTEQESNTPASPRLTVAPDSPIFAKTHSSDVNKQPVVVKTTGQPRGK